MKRNWIIWGLALFVILFTGESFSMTFESNAPGDTMTVRAEASRNDTVLTEITTGLPFNVDVYMNNTDTMPVAIHSLGHRMAYSMPFCFFDSSGTITSITRIDSGGIGSGGNILVKNNFASFWSMLWWPSYWSYDGSLPDSLNFTGAGFSDSGWPFDLGELLYYRFAFQIDQTGFFCIDSIKGRNSTYDWLLDSPSPAFGPEGPYCWQVVNPVDVGEKPNDILPKEFSLSQNRPNPFNPSTVIDFALPTRSNVSINIFNVLGQKVRTLVDREFDAGYHKETWNGKTENGTSAASGIYFYKIDAGDYTDTKKMIMLK